MTQCNRLINDNLGNQAQATPLLNIIYIQSHSGLWRVEILHNPTVFCHKLWLCKKLPPLVQSLFHLFLSYRPSSFSLTETLRGKAFPFWCVLPTCFPLPLIYQIQEVGVFLSILVPSFMWGLWFWFLYGLVLLICDFSLGFQLEFDCLLLCLNDETSIGFVCLLRKSCISENWESELKLSLVSPFVVLATKLRCGFYNCKCR